MYSNLSMSISFKKSTTKTNLNHNNRNFTDKQKEKNNHINYDRSEINQYLIQRDLKELYKTEFGPALEKYNQKQTRSDRKIDSYFNHIKDSKKTSLQQEMIIQVGDKDYYQNGGDWRVGNHILEEWLKDFEIRNPNLKIYNAVIHNDEASPHLHLNFVPVASGYKRGLEKQVAFDKAIKQQDPTLDKIRPFEDWREKEVNFIAKKLNEFDIKRKIVGTNHYKDVNDYKIKKDLEREIKELSTDLSMKKQELSVYNKNNISEIKLDVVAKKEMKKVKIEIPREENSILGKMGIPRTKEVEESTGNLLVTQDDFKKIQEYVKHSKTTQGTLDKLLEIDVLKENKKLKEENKDIYSKLKNEKLKNDDFFFENIDLKEEVKDLKKETVSLRGQISNLKLEIGSIYKSSRDFLKENTDDSSAFKRMINSLVDKITERLDKTALGNNFKKEHNKEQNRSRGSRTM